MTESSPHNVLQTPPVSLCFHGSKILTHVLLFFIPYREALCLISAFQSLVPNIRHDRDNTPMLNFYAEPFRAWE